MAAHRDIPARPEARDDVVFRTLADEWVLYDPKTNQVHVLNLSAALVWSSCDGKRTVPEIVQDVAASFPDKPSPDSVADDVVTAIQQFVQEGLLIGDGA